MNHVKAKPRYDENKRNLLISYVPDQSGIDTKYPTFAWAQQFKRRLDVLKITTILSGGTIDGYHRDDDRHISRDSACYTDFLVLFTLDYAEKPPEQLNEVIHNRNCLRGYENSDKTLMWILKLDSLDFRVCEFGQYSWWHVLKGSEYQERFIIELDEVTCRDEQTKAAQLISDHPSCEWHSPVCPSHQTEQSASPGFTFRLPRLFGWRGSPI